MGTKVISLAMFRHRRSAYEDPNCGDWAEGRFFPRHLPAVIRAVLACFPGWEIRIHHDGSAWHSYYCGALANLEREGLVKLVYVGPAGTLCGSMLWRMLPAWDPKVDAVICRDLDSLPSPRERLMIEEWLASGLAVHAIHDSTSHNGTPLMGGMIAVRPQRFRELTGFGSYEDMIGRADRRGLDLNNHGSDQVLLNLEAWPRVRGECFMHKLKGGRDEGAAQTRWEVPLLSTLTPEEEAANRLCPHIGALFNHHEAVTEYDKLVGTMPRIERIHAAERRSETVVGIPQPVDAKQRALFSCSLNPDYAFYMPMTAILWRACGYQPVCLLVGSPEQWSQGACGLALREARAIGLEVHYVPAADGHLDSTVAQVCRLYAGALPIHPDCFVMTGDIDMWPLRKSFFNVAPTGNGALHVLFANAYLKDAGGGRLVPEGKYPICYLGATVQTWREIMQLPKSTGRIGDEVREQLDAGLGRHASSSVAWLYDELLFGHRCGEWPRFKQASLRSRHGQPPTDRIDRGGWPQDITRAAASASDAHMLRPGHHVDNWPRVRELWNLILPTNPALQAWADHYRGEFVQALS